MSFKIKKLITSTAIILIFQLIDMLSCGPIIFYATDCQELSKKFTSKNDIKILKNLGCICYAYSCIISMIAFSIFSTIKGTIVAGIVVESLQPMVKAYSKNIVENVDDINGFVTNYILHLFITAFLFGIFSLIIKKFNCAHFLSRIPKSIINGCLGAIGLGQLSVAFECIQPNGDSIMNHKYLLGFAVLSVLIYYLLEYFVNFDMLIPVYSLSLILLFYSIGYLKVGKGQFFEYFRKNEWMSDAEPIIGINYLLSRIKFSKISFKALSKNFLEIITMVLISSVHIIVNLPSFSMATGINFDFSDELKAQGLSNLFTFIPNYFICSYSISTVKVGGNSRFYTLIAGISMILLALFGVLIKGFIPKFVLSLVPGIMFISFLISSFYDTLFFVSFFDYVLSVFVCIIAYLTEKYLYAILAGFLVYLVVYLTIQSRKGKRAEIQFLDKEVQIKKLDSHIIKVDYILWFLTLQKFIKPNKCKNLILDFTNCKAIDWLGADLIEQSCEMAENVYFVGDPFGFRRKRFSKPNFSFFKDYQEFENREAI